MGSDLFEFSWGVLDSYGIEGRPTRQGLEWPHLALGVRWSHAVKVHRPGTRLYSPLRQEAGLFRTFAELSPTPQAILEFAHRYGHLGVESEWVATPVIGCADEDGIEEHLVGTQWPAESIDLWADEIRDMRDAVQVWDMAHEVRQLGARLKTDPEYRPGLVTFDSETGPIDQNPDGSLRCRTRRETWIERHEGQGVVSLALHYVEAAINKHLGQIRAQSVLDEQSERLQLRFTPANLLEAMWLQFAESLGADRDLARCSREGCGRWFERAPQAKRRTAVYCSPACRNKAWRERKEQAAANRSETLSELATQPSHISRVREPSKRVANGRRRAKR